MENTMEVKHEGGEGISFRRFRIYPRERRVPVWERIGCDTEPHKNPRPHAIHLLVTLTGPGGIDNPRG
jgi:hypothetical protein